MFSDFSVKSESDSFSAFQNLGVKNAKHFIFSYWNISSIRNKWYSFQQIKGYIKKVTFRDIAKTRKLHIFWIFNVGKRLERKYVCRKIEIIIIDTLCNTFCKIFLMETKIIYKSNNLLLLTF